MMNMKHLLMLLALGGLGASCSNDELVDGSNPIAGRTELQIAFSGSGEGQEYTRAIASDSENTIAKLEVYLFASDGQGGTYRLLDVWEEGTAYAPATPDVTNFQKQASGTGWKATLYPRDLKNYPWIKLLCVANNGAAGSTTTDGKFYEKGGAEMTALTKLVADANGTVTNSAAATTEADFRKAYTAALGADAAGIIGHIVPAEKKIAPLLMTGEGITKISGSVSKVDITLKRVMARFDIENKITSSNLTIETVSLAQGRKNASLWGDAPEAVADLTTLATYQPIDFAAMPGANYGMLESAYYVYPGLATDESYLIIKGKYKSPVTSQQIPVTYEVPITRTEGDVATYIPLKANSRYKLRISDVSQSNVFASFEVVDWTSGGGITIRPENDAPVFAGKGVFGTVEGETNIVPDTLLTSSLKNSYEVDGDAGAFTVTIAATGKVRAEKGDVAVRAAGNEWLNCALATSEERDGVYYSTFKIEYVGAIGQQPVALHFINESASFDPALWTTLNFYGPKAKPAFAVVTAGGSSKGNTTEVDATTKAPTATLYNLNGSFVKFNITCLEGLEVDATAATGYEVTKENSVGSVHTYKFAVKDATKANGGTVIFKNVGDDTKTTTLTLTSETPDMAFKEAATPAVGGTWDVATATLKIDLDALTSTGYIFEIKAPQGVGAPANLAACPWLTITESKAWADGVAEYTITPKADPVDTDDFDLVFTNGLTEGAILAPSLTVKLHKDFSKPKFAAGTTTDSWSTFNVGLASGFTTATAATLEMYNVSGSKVTVNMTCAEAASFEAVDGLSVTKVGATDEYTIEVTDVTKLTDATTVLTVNNDAPGAGTDRKATLTITWKSAAITVDLTSDDSGNVVKTVESNGNIVYTVDIANLGGTGFTFTVDAKGGAATDLSVLSGTFLKKHLSNTGTDAVTAGAVSTYQFRLDDDSQTADITLVFTNTITGGVDQKIIFKAKI